MQDKVSSILEAYDAMSYEDQLESLGFVVKAIKPRVPDASTDDIVDVLGPHSPYMPRARTGR